MRDKPIFKCQWSQAGWAEEADGRGLKVRLPPECPGLRFCLLIGGRPYTFFFAFILVNFFLEGVGGQPLRNWNILSVMDMQ